MNAVEHNETIYREMGNWCRSVENASRLIEHPHIKCHWPQHADRPAVIRKDMRYPECRGCAVENPYE